MTRERQGIVVGIFWKMPPKIRKKHKTKEGN